jgi:hypothetical protein
VGADLPPARKYLHPLSAKHPCRLEPRPRSVKPGVRRGRQAIRGPTPGPEQRQGRRSRSAGGAAGAGRT